MGQHVSAVLTSHNQVIHKFRPFEHDVLLLVGSHVTVLLYAYGIPLAITLHVIWSKFMCGLMMARQQSRNMLPH
jgi:hypothetical protein